MNKIMKTLAIAAVAAVAMTGSAMAAPKGAQSPKGGAKVEQRASQPKQTVKSAPKQTQRHKVAHKSQPSPKHEVARHNKPEPPRVDHRPSPKPESTHHHHHNNGTLHTEDWCSIGASLVGGLIGGIIGAAM